MKEQCVNLYRIGREFAGLGMEEAASMLHCSVRSLHNYETGCNVPDDVVALMADAYQMPTLAVLHLKRSDNPLARFIPDVVEPQTFGDVGMNAVLSQAEVAQAIALFTKIMRDGKITIDEYSDLASFARMMRVVSGHALSAALYAETTLLRHERAEKLAS